MNRLSSLILFLLLATSACIREPLAPATGRATGADFLVEVWASQACASYGDNITVRATVTNVSAETRTIKLERQVVFDLIVADQDGEHRWSEGKPLTSELSQLELKPRQSKTIGMQWVVKERTSGFLVTAQFVDNPNDSRGPMKATARVYAPGCFGG